METSDQGKVFARGQKVLFIEGLSGMDDRVKKERIAQARAEIAKRIKGVCKGLTPDELERLLDRMALIHWKYHVDPNVPDVPDSGPIRKSSSEQCC